MIGVRAPLRISLFGGGTDIPRIFNEIEGCVFSCAINKYVHIFVNKVWPEDEKGVIAKYSLLEKEMHPRYLRHPIMRTVLLNQKVDGIDISVSSDLPGGTGLGSSSAFTVAFTLAIKTHLKESVSKLELANQACEIEIKFLQEPIGKQDAFASAFGGLKAYEFLKNGDTNVKTSLLNERALSSLQNSLYLVRVGGFRKTADLLQQQLRELERQSRMISIYSAMANQAKWASLQTEFDAIEFGDMLDQAWQYKKSLNPSITNLEIEETIERGKKYGATGAKLLGAGGSGFVLFIVPEIHQQKFLTHMDSLRVINPKIDAFGAQIVIPEGD